MLPKTCPKDVVKLQPDYRSCYKRFIAFHRSQMLHCPTPPGLWNRLLSRIMNTVKEVKSILSELEVKENDLTIPTNIQNDDTTTSALNSFCEDLPDQNTGNSVASETMSISPSNFEGPLESTILSLSVASKSLSTTIESQKVSYGGVLSVDGDGSLVYWSTGLVYSVNELTFSIESLAENAIYHNKDGILIFTSQGIEGRNMLCQLIDIVEKLISEWYPGLSDELEHTVPCPECLKSDITNPYEFKVDQLLPLIAGHKLTHKCDANHEVQLFLIYC